MHAPLTLSPCLSSLSLVERFGYYEVLVDWHTASRQAGRQAGVSCQYVEMSKVRSKLIGHRDRPVRSIAHNKLIFKTVNM